MELLHLEIEWNGNTAFFEDVNNLREENRNLQARNRELQEELSKLEIVRAENAILRAYNDMIEMFQEYETVAAHVINKNITNLSETIIINVGTDQGVHANMPVISGEGLVGVVLSSTNNTAKVAPIIDPASSVSARISTSRDTVITRGMLGNDRNIRLMHIPTDTELIVGDNIETSGLRRSISKRIENRNYN